MPRTLKFVTKAFNVKVFNPIKLAGKECINEIFQSMQELFLHYRNPPIFILHQRTQWLHNLQDKTVIETLDEILDEILDLYLSTVKERLNESRYPK